MLRKLVFLLPGQAINAMNGFRMDGKTLAVRIAGATGGGGADRAPPGRPSGFSGPPTGFSGPPKVSGFSGPPGQTGFSGPPGGQGPSPPGTRPGGPPPLGNARGWPLSINH
jgi:splicing factor 1